jgi:hypothetical protein
VVFSSLNHALADLLDPGRLGHQLGCGTLEADVERIAAAVEDPGPWRADPQALAALLAASGEQVLVERWREALGAIGRHWQGLQEGEAPLRCKPVWRIRWEGRRQRLLARLGRSAG